MAAAYLFHICQHHAFADGNKRTAFAATYTFLAINGIQTMSAQTYNLLAQMPELLRMGIDSVRISPQPQHIPAIVAAFDAARRGECGKGVQPDMTGWAADGMVDGYWFGEAGIANHATHNRAALA